MKKILSILLVLVITLMPISVNASGIDILFNAIINKEERLSGLDVIYNILGKKYKVKKNEEDGQEVEIITSEKELEKVEVDDVKGKLLGIDVSKWNGDINWKKVKKAGIQFAIIRAGYGQNTVDIQFERNIQGCIDNDIYVGIYWFSYAYNNEMAVNEAKKCLEVIKPYKKYIKIPVWFDFEYDSVAYATRCGIKITKQKCTNITNAFCEEIEKNGYKTGIYTNIDFTENYYTKEILNKYNVWIADWTGNCSYTGKYICWQYTDNGKVNGIIGKCDMDIYYGDEKVK